MYRMGVSQKESALFCEITSIFLLFRSMQIKQFTPTSHKIKAVIYGESGTGKTSFGGTCPNAIFASAESGLLSIAHLNPEYVEIITIQDLAELLVYLKK